MLDAVAAHCAAQARPRGTGYRRQPRGRAPPAASAALLPPSAKGEAAKATLLGRLAGVQNRGIFGLPDVERLEIDALARQVEACSPLEAPTERLAADVAGAWRLLYTTITIRGGTRTKLGLRGALTLGELQQVITCDAGGPGGCGDAVNTVAFSLAGMAQGSFTVDARYTVASPTRVDITYSSSRLEPKQLQAIFGDQVPLLLSIFNPEGWLEITYVDASLRMGRDDKGHLFVLERE